MTDIPVAVTVDIDSSTSKYCKALYYAFMSRTGMVMYNRDNPDNRYLSTVPFSDLDTNDFLREMTAQYNRANKTMRIYEGVADILWSLVAQEAAFQTEGYYAFMNGYSYTIKPESSVVEWTLLHMEATDAYNKEYKKSLSFDRTVDKYVAWIKKAKEQGEI